MFTVYLYVLDTMADWEPGFAAAELNSGRFFRADAPRVTVRTVGANKAPVRTMGGLTVLPECAVSEIAADKKSVLLLPGADAWNDAKHRAVIVKAAELLCAGGTVCAICGATVALADAGLLNDRRHTSNGAGFLESFCPAYTGGCFYVDSPCVADGDLITAGASGALAWAKQIIARLDVFRPDTLEAWYAFFSTGAPQRFFELMQTLPSADQ